MSAAAGSAAVPSAMEAWPSLAAFGRSIPNGRGSSFFFDSEASVESARRSQEAFILIHGLGDEADSWRRVFPILAKAERAIALDLPGFGRSVAGGRSNVAACARAVEGLMDAEGLERVVLVGSSLGASVAQLVARRESRPRRESRKTRASSATPASRGRGRVAALALVDGGLPSSGSSSSVLAMALPIVGERAYAGLRGRDEEAYASLAPYYSDINSLSEEDRAFLRQRVIERVESETQMRAYFSLLRSLILWASFRGGYFKASLATFPGPILVAWGAADRIFESSNAGRLSSFAQRAQSLIIAGSGHLPQQEAPEELGSSLLELAKEAWA